MVSTSPRREAISWRMDCTWDQVSAWAGCTPRKLHIELLQGLFVLGHLSFEHVIIAGHARAPGQDQGRQGQNRAAFPVSVHGKTSLFFRCIVASAGQGASAAHGAAAPPPEQQIKHSPEQGQKDGSQRPQIFFPLAGKVVPHGMPNRPQVGQNGK